ncbi:unnamed protein product [Soboliphyme baturini]|uniref:Carbamoyl-phosphate synthase (glutamine-hydrolyzing) n=1 Tax=Soboliphyme baturini TaxID=241478 RepID=A0A183J3X8_9BILA|nr:unnamed protein product [Soboliphyme baturini]
MSATLKALQDHSTNPVYVDLMKELNNFTATDTKRYDEPCLISTEVRQRDIHLSRTFPDGVGIPLLPSELGGGINIDGKRVIHLHFTEQIISYMNQINKDYEVAGSTCHRSEDENLQQRTQRVPSRR